MYKNVILITLFGMTVVSVSMWNEFTTEICKHPPKNPFALFT